MPKSSNKSSGAEINRRRLLQGLSAVGAIGLAGCGGSENGDSELGERVPTIPMTYWSGIGPITTNFEQISEIVIDNLSELGLDVEAAPTELVTALNDAFNDERTGALRLSYNSNSPDRLDPQEQTRRFAADWAGADGNSNNSNYASCEYSEFAIRQLEATSEDNRRELVNEAHSIMSRDTPIVTLTANLILGAAQNVEPASLGSLGYMSLNPSMYVNVSPTDGDTIITAEQNTVAESPNFLVRSDSSAISLWSHIMHSTLTEYNEDLELVNLLVDNYEIEDEATTITAELKDATFHNGDPITAEDVQFTFSHLADNSHIYPQVGDPGYESINIIDDKTVEFNMRAPRPSLITRTWPRWGILHKETWVEAGAPENPDNPDFPDEFIGSGPFRVVEIRSGDRVNLAPHDGHPIHKPDHDLVLNFYPDEQGAFQAFRSGDLHVMPGLSPGNFQEAEEMENVDTTSNPGFMPYNIYPQCSYAPGMFQEFRHAVAAAIDRQTISQVVFRGMVEPEMYSCPLPSTHPWYPGSDNLYEMADDPGGNIDTARQMLEDEGWGWDSNGNLHYPPDYDTFEAWPQGETPNPEEFECLGDDGEFTDEFLENIGADLE